MLIGELSAKTGLTKDTIRFYEKIKLISISKNSRRENRYKEYPEAILQKIMVIQQLKNFGFTLNEIDEMISLYEEDLISCIDNIPKVKSKIEMIDRKIIELQNIKSALLKCIKNCPADCEIDSVLKGLNTSK